MGSLTVRAATMTNSEYHQLIEFLGQQFAVVDRRFTDHDRRFDAADRRFDAIEAQLRDILGHFDQLYVRLDRLSSRPA